MSPLARVCRPIAGVIQNPGARLPEHPPCVRSEVAHPTDAREPRATLDGVDELTGWILVEGSLSLGTCGVVRVGGLPGLVLKTANWLSSYAQ